MQQIVQPPYVEWFGYRRPEQKIDRTLRQAKTSFAEEFQKFPPVVSLFEGDSDGRLESVRCVRAAVTALLAGARPRRIIG
jgi:hypothetical protein